MLASLAVHAAVAGWAARPARQAPAPPAIVAGEHFTAPEMEDVRPDPPAPADDPPAAPPIAPPRSARAPTSTNALGASGPSAATPPPGPRSSSAAPAIAGPEPPTLFGALGDRSAVDLVLAFTRAFPQAASADPAWVTAPLGDAGTADVAITLDDTGRIAASESTGGTTPLRAGVARTLALIGGRVFVARAASTRLRIHATIAADDVHDGLHGDVFALGASVQAGAGEGNAFFALAVGRRVDLRILLR